MQKRWNLTAAENDMLLVCSCNSLVPSSLCSYWKITGVSIYTTQIALQYKVIFPYQQGRITLCCTDHSLHASTHMCTLLFHLHPYTLTHRSGRMLQFRFSILLVLLVADLLLWLPTTNLTTMSSGKCNQSTGWHHECGNTQLHHWLCTHGDHGIAPEGGNWTCVVRFGAMHVFRSSTHSVQPVVDLLLWHHITNSTTMSSGNSR